MSDRADRLVELLPRVTIDLLLITALVNVRYMTGYTGSNGLALVGPHTRVFVTDFRYVEQAKAEVQSSFERKRDQLELYEGIIDSLPGGDEITARLRRRQHHRAPARAAARAAARPRAAGRGRRARRGAAGGQGAQRDRADPQGGAGGRRRARARARSRAWSAAPSASSRTRSSSRCARAAPIGPALN